MKYVSTIFSKLRQKDAIRKVADGISDEIPQDEAYAEQSHYKRLVAPPSWLHSVFLGASGITGYAFHVSTQWEFSAVYLNDRIGPSYFTGFDIENFLYAERLLSARKPVITIKMKNWWRLPDR